MIEAERAKEIADYIEQSSPDGYWDPCDREETALIVSALRAYSVPVSTDAGLREAVAKAMNGGTLPPVGESVAHLCVAQYRVDAFAKADAALSAIHASGWLTMPREPTDAMIKAGVEYRLRTTVTDWHEDTKRLYEVMRDARK